MSGVKGKWNFGPLVSEHEDGEKPVVKRIPEIDGLADDPLDPDAVRQIRAFVDKTQLEFALLVGVSLRTIKAWEHPNRKNSEARNCTGAGRRLLVLIARHPEVVEILEDIT